MVDGNDFRQGSRQGFRAVRGSVAAMLQFQRNSIMSSSECRRRMGATQLGSPLPRQSIDGHLNDEEEVLTRLVITARSPMKTAIGSAVF